MNSAELQNYRNNASHSARIFDGSVGLEVGEVSGLQVVVSAEALRFSAMPERALASLVSAEDLCTAFRSAVFQALESGKTPGEEITVKLHGIGEDSYTLWLSDDETEIQVS